MAPLQHHFELKGWSEVLVVVRFWIIQGMCVIVGSGPLLRGMGGRQVSTRLAGQARHRRRARRLRHPGGPGAARARRRRHRRQRRRRRARRARRPPSWRRWASPCASATAATLPEGTELVVTAPGWKPDKPLFAAAAEAACRSGATSSWPGGCAGPDAAPWLARHRHQRQDHDRPDARLDPEGGGPAHGRRRQHRRLAARRGPRRRAVRRPRRRTVQLPAALGALACAPTPPPCSTSPPTTSTGTAPWRRTPPTRAGSTRAIRSPASTTSPTRPPRTWCARRTSRRAAGPSASPSARPGPSQLGVVDGILVDRAFVENRQKHAQELAEVSDVNPPAPHNIANALAAAALARAFGVPARGRTRRAARLPPRRPPHRARRRRGRGRVRRRLQGHQHPRRARPRWRPTSRSCGSRAASPRAPTFDELVAEVGEAAARRRADRRRPRADPRSPRATRPGGPGRRPRPDRHWGDARGGPGGARGSPGRGRHGAAGPGLRLDGHVRQLQQAR